SPLRRGLRRASRVHRDRIGFGLLGLRERFRNEAVSLCQELQIFARERLQHVLRGQLRHVLFAVLTQVDYLARHRTLSLRAGTCGPSRRELALLPAACRAPRGMWRRTTHATSKAGALRFHPGRYLGTSERKSAS